MVGVLFKENINCSFVMDFRIVVLIFFEQ